MQMEEDDVGSKDAGGGEDDMIFMEFQEALGAVAHYKLSNPYLSFAEKVQTFIEKMLFTNLSGKGIFIKAKKKKKK